MANFEGVTASSGVEISEEHREKLQDLLKQYDFGEVTAEIDSDGHLYIYGYDWFQAHKRDREDEIDSDNDVTEEFLEKLREFIPDGQVLEIHMQGHEKCRFPLSMSKVEVIQEKVTWSNL